MESLHLFDGKEMFLQRIEEPLLTYTNHNIAVADSFYNVLIREWNPETFEFSDLKEVRVSKNA